MRLAPVAIAFASDLDLADTLCRAGSMTTHPLPVCVEACGAWGRLIALAAQGASREVLYAHAEALAGQVHDGALLAVNLGHDADTVGSVYGQLAGTFYGLNAIPQSWVRQLADGEMVLETAHELAGLSGTVAVSEETAGLLDTTG